MLITPKPPAGEEHRVAKVLDSIHALFGSVPEGMQLYSISPEVLEHRWAGMQYYIHHPRLGMSLLAFIRLLVSDRMGAPFCIGLNRTILISKGITEEAIDVARKNPAQAPLSKAEVGLLQLVLKAVTEPLAVTAQDFDVVRQLGWQEGDILDGILHGANNVAADIVFNTYKVGIESC
ncbi:MAG: hypothetical protein HQL77_00890 [Magnetococcales bacterium]|nr:hypothetical protein [Magnetococcales bacterium]